MNIRFVESPPLDSSHDVDRSNSGNPYGRIGRVSAEDVVQAYQETGSGWAAGKKLGITGGSVYERLSKLGYKVSNPQWTDDEFAELERLVDARVTMSEIAARLGRPFAGVAAKASRNGLHVRKGRSARTKLPRGVGYDKESTRKNLNLYYNYSGTVTKFARSQGLGVESLVQAFQKHFPEEWGGYVASHNIGETRTCEYCQEYYFPQNGKQRFCTRKCSFDSRRDHEYFGGKRRTAIGWGEKTCQLCERSNIKGLSAHHVLGKENDPEDTYLITVCTGCHQIITLLAGKKREFVDDPSKWESLISLVWIRRHGDDGFPPDAAVRIGVDIEYEESDEELAG